MYYTIRQQSKNIQLENFYDGVVGVKADYHTRDIGLWLECPPWGSFYEIVARIYLSFEKNHGKRRAAISIYATED